MDEATTILNLALSRGLLSPKQADEARGLTPEQIVSRGLIDAREMEMLRRLSGTPRLIGGRYEIIDELGRGGMGVVYRCRDRQLDRIVAVKGFTGAVGDEGDRFEREARTAARLRHPNIVAVHDYGRDGRDLFLVMDLIDGRPLGVESPRRVAEIVEQIAAALAYAHRQDVVHRDVKPENILVDARGHASLTDFGLARRLEGDATLTTTGMIMGTPAYMSPEQATGAKPDKRSDLFSLGATIYFALTGVLPRNGPSPLAVALSAVTEDPPPPRSLRADIDVDIETICLKAMERDPARRYATAEEMQADLQRYLRGEPISARRPSLIYRVRRRIARNPWAWSAAGAAVILVAIVTQYYSHKVRGLVSSEEAVREADAALVTWRMERYAPRHDVTPTRRRVEAAIGRLREALRSQPQAPAVHAKLGWALHELGRTDEARAALDTAVGLAPAEGRYRAWRGKVLLRASAELNAKAMQELSPADRDRVRAEAVAMREAAMNELRAAAAGAWTGDPGERELVRAIVRLSDGHPEDLEEIGRTQWQGGEEAYIQLASYVHPDYAKQAEYCALAAQRAPSWASAYVAGARAMNYLGLDLVGAPSDEAFADSLVRAAAAIEIDPEGAEGYVERGKTRVNWALAEFERGDDPSGRLREAFADGERAAALEPGNPEAWMVRGHARVNTGRLKDRLGEAPDSDYEAAANEDYARWIELQRDDPEPYVSRGLARSDLAAARMGRGEDSRTLLEQALREDFDRAVELDPKSARAWMGRGGAGSNLAFLTEQLGGDAEPIFRRAVEDLEKAVALDAAWSHPRSILGGVRTNLGRYLAQNGVDPVEHFRLAVEQDFAAALKLNERDAEVWESRGTTRYHWALHLHESGGDPEALYDAAIGDYERSLELNDANPDTWRRLSLTRCRRALFWSGTGRDPMEEFRRAIEVEAATALELNPNDADAWINRGRAWLYLGFHVAGQLRSGEREYEQAVADYTEATARAPGSAEAWTGLGMARSNLAMSIDMRGGDADEHFRLAVEQDFTRGLKSNPNSLDGLIGRGGARANWSRSLAKRGGDPRLLLGQALEEDYGPALKLNPTFASLWVDVGLAEGTWAIYLGEQGDSEGARERFARADDALTKAIGFNSGNAESHSRRGYYRLLAGRRAEAKADFEKAVELNPALEGALRPWIDRASEDF